LFEHFKEIVAACICDDLAVGPPLLVCIRHLSPATRATIENAVFCVNVLRADQSHIPDSFAGNLQLVLKSPPHGALWPQRRLLAQNRLALSFRTCKTQRVSSLPDRWRQAVANRTRWKYPHRRSSPFCDRSETQIHSLGNSPKN
jgi:hypothetical protein